MQKSLAFAKHSFYNAPNLNNFRKAQMKNTILLGELAEFQSGTPQFRISECTDAHAPIYDYYSQSDLEADLWQHDTPTVGKQVRTTDTVSLTATNDVLFSLISGKAVQVQAIHAGRLYTQNYIKLTPKKELDTAYLIYLLNENADIARQFGLGLQGSQVLKYTIKQLKELALPPLPSLDVQRAIGEIYLNNQKLTTLKKRLADNEHRLTLAKLTGVNQ